MKESYVKHVILHYALDGNFDVQFENGWIHADALAEISTRTASEAFAAYGLRVGTEYQPIIDDVFATLIGNHAIAQTGDEYAGVWFRLSISKKNEIVTNLINENPASKIVAKLPEAALKNALNQIAQEDGLHELYDADPDGAIELNDVVEAEAIPGSDRFVSLSHNQVSALDEEATKLIEAVETLNAIDGDAGLRASIIGGLKAGRELIRAGVFKLYALQVTLVEALKFLIIRYEREVIGALAAELLSALVNHLGTPL